MRRVRQVRNDRRREGGRREYTPGTGWSTSRCRANFRRREPHRTSRKRSRIPQRGSRRPLGDPEVFPTLLQDGQATSAQRPSDLTQYIVHSIPAMSPERLCRLLEQSFRLLPSNLGVAVRPRINRCRLLLRYLGQRSHLAPPEMRRVDAPRCPRPPSIRNPLSGRPARKRPRKSAGRPACPRAAPRPRRPARRRLRTSIVRLLPPCLAGGISGATSTHSSSVKSLE